MKQKSLVIAIVAIVAVVVVIGLWVTGAAGSGPLAGCDGCEVAPIPPRTILTFTATEIVACEDGLQGRWIQFSGTLKDISNNPVPNRNVNIYKTGSSYTVASFTTDSNGAFSGPKGINDCCPMTFYAVFAGDGQYQASQSTTASVPASNYCNQ